MKDSLDKLPDGVREQFKAIRKRMNDSYKKLFCFECLEKLPDISTKDSKRKVNSAIKKHGWTIWGDAGSKPKRLYLVCKKCN